MKDDFIEIIMFGSIGHRTDKDGNRTKLTQEELWELKHNPDAVTREINVQEIIDRYER